MYEIFLGRNSSILGQKEYPRTAGDGQIRERGEEKGLFSILNEQIRIV